MTNQELMQKAYEIIEQSEMAADADAGFDAGEFSGPAHGKMLEQKLTELAKQNYFTYETLMQMLNDAEHQDQENTFENMKKFINGEEQNQFIGCPC